MILCQSQHIKHPKPKILTSKQKGRAGLNQADPQAQTLNQQPKASPSTQGGPRLFQKSAVGSKLKISESITTICKKDKTRTEVITARGTPRRHRREAAARGEIQILIKKQQKPHFGNNRLSKNSANYQTL